MMKKILVVDDERLNINVLVELLKDKYKMMAAKNGEQALKAVHSSNRPDLILLDIMMPDMDGYEVCRRLKADDNTKEIPIIFISAMSEVSDETKGFELGAVDYITKPISPAVVLARVNTHLVLQEAKELIKQQIKRMEYELAVARDIQLSMVPKKFPVLDGIDVFAKMEPAREVGGDFYDVFMIDDESLCLCIGDVSGKGAPAALFMAKAKTLIKAYASSDSSTASIMTRVNDELCDGNDENLFVTVFLSILNIRTGALKITNAGHNLPYIIKEDKTLVTIKNQNGPIIAAIDGLTYTEDVIQLEKNDTFFLFTDGVTEAMDKDEQLYGEARLEEYLLKSDVTNVQTTVDGVMTDVSNYEDGTEQTDDVTVLSCYFSGHEIIASTEISINNQLTEIDTVVQHFDAFCETNNIAMQYNQKINLSLDDLINNIISYGYTDDLEHAIKIVFKLYKNKIMIIVEDNAIPFNPFKDRNVDTSLSIDDRDIGGLGIYLIKELMSTCDYERKVNKNVVVLTMNIDD